jgi:hypothetical protein
MFARIAILVVIIVVIPLGVSADETTGTSTSYLAWVGAGAIVLNSGVAVANGLSLTAGSTNRRNGMFGVVLGSTTMAISAVGLVAADDDQSQNFSLLLGAAGLASAVTGALTIKFAGPSGEHVSFSPLVDPFGSDHKAKAGLQLKILF